METRSTVVGADGAQVVVVQRGPRWVFDLWTAGEYRCAARTVMGPRCRRAVNLQAGLCRKCEKHRSAQDPVYYLQPTQRQEPCPCGCGYAVVAHVLTATLISGP